jgi:hypothetical protein
MPPPDVIAALSGAATARSKDYQCVRQTMQIDDSLHSIEPSTQKLDPDQGRPLFSVTTCDTLHF